MSRLREHAIAGAGGGGESQDARGHASRGQAHCWVVADGLGGHRGGSRAARRAVDAVLASFAERPGVAPENVRRHLEAAHAAVLALQREDAAIAGCRSTAVVLVADGRRAAWGHVGDSRLYWIREGRIVFQTRDHSVPGAMAEAGEMAPEAIRFHEDRPVLLRCLGSPGALRPAVAGRAERVDAGDRFVLCSDGFWEPVDEGRLLELVEDDDGSGRWLERAAAHLRAADPAGADDYTAVSVWVEGTSGAVRPLGGSPWTWAGSGALVAAVLAGVLWLPAREEGSEGEDLRGIAVAARGAPAPRPAPKTPRGAAKGPRDPQVEALKEIAAEARAEGRVVERSRDGGGER